MNKLRKWTDILRAL